MFKHHKTEKKTDILNENHAIEPIFNIPSHVSPEKLPAKKDVITEDEVLFIGSASNRVPRYYMSHVGHLMSTFIGLYVCLCTYCALLSKMFLHVHYLSM